MITRNIAIFLLLGLVTVCIAQKKETEELQVEDDSTSKEPVYKSDRDLPQFRGADFVIDLKPQFFELETKDKSRTAVIFFGVDWCPHCRNFVPEFNIAAYENHYTKKYAEKDLVFFKYIV